MGLHSIRLLANSSAGQDGNGPNRGRVEAVVSIGYPVGGAGCAGDRLTGRTKCETVSAVLSNPSATRDQIATAMEMGREETDDNGEDNEDDGLSEPSLGSSGDLHLNQERWAAGGRRDLEQDDGETGIGDQDGLDEQVPFRDWQNVGMV